MEFNSKLNELLSKAAKEHKPCYLLGYYNIDLLKYQQHFHTDSYLDNLFSHCFLPLINRPTRITSHSASLIDNIFRNNLTSDSKSGILFTDISDHLPIFTLLCQTEANTSSQNIILNKRLVNAKTKENFTNQLTDYNWDSVYKAEDPEEAYKNFVDAYKEIDNNSFPIRRISRNQAKLYSKPWITKGLLKSIKTKYNLYKKFLSHPSPLNDANYKKYKNKLNHQLKISKCNYYDKKFETAKGNLKETWKILNEVINKRKTRSKMPSLFCY